MHFCYSGKVIFLDIKKIFYVYYLIFLNSSEPFQVKQECSLKTHSLNDAWNVSTKVQKKLSQETVRKLLFLPS